MSCWEPHGWSTFAQQTPGWSHLAGNGPPPWARAPRFQSTAAPPTQAPAVIVFPSTSRVFRPVMPASPRPQPPHAASREAPPPVSQAQGHPQRRASHQWGLSRHQCRCRCPLGGPGPFRAPSLLSMIIKAALSLPCTLNLQQRWGSTSRGWAM